MLSKLNNHLEFITLQYAICKMQNAICNIQYAVIFQNKIFQTKPPFRSVLTKLKSLLTFVDDFVELFG